MKCLQFDHKTVFKENTFSIQSKATPELAMLLKRSHCSEFQSHHLKMGIIIPQRAAVRTRKDNVYKVLGTYQRLNKSYHQHHHYHKTRVPVEEDGNRWTKFNTLSQTLGSSPLKTVSGYQPDTNIWVVFKSLCENHCRSLVSHSLH